MAVGGSGGQGTGTWAPSTGPPPGRAHCHLALCSGVASWRHASHTSPPRLYSQGETSNKLARASRGAWNTAGAPQDDLRLV